MGLKYIKDFKLFEEIDAFERVGKKLWVDLKSSGVEGIPGGDERSYYFSRFEPENVLPSEMDKLRKYDPGLNDDKYSLDESDKFDFDEYLKRGDTYSEKVSGRLFNLARSKSEWWEYLGERNGSEWGKSISELLNKQTYRPLDEKERFQISEWLKPVLSDENSTKGWNTITKTHQDWVQYPTLKSVQNSRFEDCWFTKKSENMFGDKYGWDMSVQGFSDEWYLVNVNDGRGYNNYWFRVDTFEGLEKFIKSVFLEG